MLDPVFLHATTNLKSGIMKMSPITWFCMVIFAVLAVLSAVPGASGHHNKHEDNELMEMITAGVVALLLQQRNR
ncbi:hypothetical protein JTE90_000910 [Oedothorax gibbosus]|uniref:Uncharacterized protein n=1 Tax=Oedothorax gibbosus TaxID=931172 RepID=A0AAV6VT09_9ARAC|nr:hypothetical protein JTE90_000910 [Oedothorax gibbosus]